MVSSTKILVIDDSSTIRRLVDSTLSREGYTVVLASNAEEGLCLAAEHQPAMILLDHQLPGTTGFAVCQKLMGDAGLNGIPVVVSSTLRKKAYVEYADLANVVDMLPKPYAEELLLTTVANALDTGTLIVESQMQGTAVPEVMNEQAESDFAGTLQDFSIREILDFLNNGRKQGTLEVEGRQKRYSIYLHQGRVLGISANGVPADDVIERLPESLSDLAPVVNVTMGRGGSALESIVDLLNTEVLDPRLLRRLLRHQAAVLLFCCFGDELKSFRFETRKPVPPLFARLPLDISVLALLVEGAITRSFDEIPSVSDSATFTRQPIRGQNLDRAGLSATQALILGQLVSAKTLNELTVATNGDVEEVRRVLYGLEMAELISCTSKEEEMVHKVIVYEPDLDHADRINKAFVASDNYQVTVVNDATAARLLAHRSCPSVIVADATNVSVFCELRAAIAASRVKWVASTAVATPLSEIAINATIVRPYTPTMLLDMLDALTTGTMVAGSNSGTTPERHVCTT